MAASIHTNNHKYSSSSHPLNAFRKQLFFSLAVLFFLAAGTVFAVLYGRGYRFSYDDGKPEVAKTGILVATSLPNGAQVFVNDHLTTATDNTINLTPGEYAIKIQKDGYFPWEKRVRIQKEEVIKAEALLFPTAPKLESITATGVDNPIMDASSTKIAYRISSQNTRKNGMYVFDTSANPVLALKGTVKQIVDDTVNTFSKASYTWSPDGDQMIASVSSALITSYYLLDAGTFNEAPQDVTAILASVEETWQNEKALREKARMDGLKKLLQKMIRDYFTILAWSPDDTKILYKAKKDSTLPLIIKPRLIGINNLKEQRTISGGSVYIYDSKEDTNWKLLDDLTGYCAIELEQCRLPVSWFPDSKHLIYVHDNKIDIVEYDGANQTTIYAGPFIDNYVFPWPNGSKIIVLTNLGNQNIPPNLYTVSLK